MSTPPGCSVRSPKLAKRNTMTLKLYVWEDVLSSFYDGIVVVLAESEEDAFKLIKDKNELGWWYLNGKPTKPRKMYELVAEADWNYKGIHPNAIHPRIVEAPEAFVMWGGD